MLQMRQICNIAGLPGRRYLQLLLWSYYSGATTLRGGVSAGEKTSSGGASLCLSLIIFYHIFIELVKSILLTTIKNFLRCCKNNKFIISAERVRVVTTYW